MFLAVVPFTEYCNPIVQVIIRALLMGHTADKDQATIDKILNRISENMQLQNSQNIAAVL